MPLQNLSIGYANLFVCGMHSLPRKAIPLEGQRGAHGERDESWRPRPGASRPGAFGGGTLIRSRTAEAEPGFASARRNIGERPGTPEGAASGSGRGFAPSGAPLLGRSEPGMAPASFSGGGASGLCAYVSCVFLLGPIPSLNE